MRENPQHPADPGLNKTTSWLGRRKGAGLGLWAWPFCFCSDPPSPHDACCYLQQVMEFGNMATEGAGLVTAQATPLPVEGAGPRRPGRFPQREQGGTWRYRGVSQSQSRGSCWRRGQRANLMHEGGA